MKIAVVTPSFPPYKGGMGNVANEFARGLAKLGHDISVFTPNYSFLGAKVRAKENGIKIYRLKPLLYYGQAALLPQLLWKLKGYDIIHLHIPFLGGAGFILLLKVFKPFKKIVLHYHMDLAGTGFVKLIFWTYVKTILPSLVRRADRVIVTSRDYFKHSLLAKLIRQDSDRLKVIPNGIDFKHFSVIGQTALIRKQLNIPTRTRVALFVGALDSAHYFKGVLYLLKAWQKIIDTTEYPCRLVIVGDGNLRTSYEKEAERLGILKTVVFAGGISDKQLPDYYQLADICILPSVDKTEAFGLVLLEAMASGTPVIASNLFGVRSLIKPGLTGWVVTPADSDELFNMLKQALGNKERLADMGKRAQIYVKAYDWSLLSKQLSELFTGLMPDSQYEDSLNK